MVRSRPTHVLRLFKSSLLAYADLVFKHMVGAILVCSTHAQRLLHAKQHVFVLEKHVDFAGND